MIDYKFIIDNFYFRLENKYPQNIINRGVGCIMPKICIMQDTAIYHNDPYQAAIKKLDIEDITYRFQINLITNESTSPILIKELIELLRPEIVVVTGLDGLNILSNKKIKKYTDKVGKIYKDESLINIPIFCITNPEKYVGSRGTIQEKRNGLNEWQQIIKNIKS